MVRHFRRHFPMCPDVSRALMIPGLSFIPGYLEQCAIQDGDWCEVSYLQKRQYCIQLLFRLCKLFLK